MDGVPGRPGLADWFVSSWTEGVHTSRVWAPAQRLVDGFVDLVRHVPAGVEGAVELALHDRWHERRWVGMDLQVSAVCAAIMRGRQALATFGGVEVSVATATDQLVLTAELSIVIYARTPRWPFLLEARGFASREVMPPPTWRPWRAPRRAEPLINEALDQLSRQLQLQEVRS